MSSEVKLPFVQLTAPERIWLAVSDEPGNADDCFPDAHEDLCWSDDEPLAVCVPYVRADFADEHVLAQAAHHALCDENLMPKSLRDSELIRNAILRGMRSTVLRSLSDYPAQPTE